MPADSNRWWCCARGSNKTHGLHRIGESTRPVYAARPSSDSLVRLSQVVTHDCVDWRDEHDQDVGLQREVATFAVGVHFVAQQKRLATYGFVDWMLWGV